MGSASMPYCLDAVGWTFPGFGRLWCSDQLKYSRCREDAYCCVEQPPYGKRLCAVSVVVHVVRLVVNVILCSRLETCESRIVGEDDVKDTSR